MIIRFFYFGVKKAASAAFYVLLQALLHKNAITSKNKTIKTRVIVHQDNIADGR